MKPFDLSESIEALERQAENPALPLHVRRRSAKQAARRRRLVVRNPQLMHYVEWLAERCSGG